MKITASIVKCKNENGIILPRVRHGSAILEFRNVNSSSLSIKQKRGCLWHNFLITFQTHHIWPDRPDRYLARLFQADNQFVKKQNGFDIT